MPRPRPLTIVPLTLAMFLLLGNTRGDKPADEMMELYGLFVDAVEQVEANYVRPIDRKELLQNALQGMLEELDPHSSYFSETQWNQFRKQIEGSFTGIGVSVEMDPSTKRLKVLAPLPGAPAYKAGVLAGDLILSVDEKSTDGMSRDEVIEALQGRPGTEVRLEVKHIGRDEPESITVTRSIIELPSVMGDARKADDSWDFLIDKERKIGYVRITNFIENTSRELRTALDELVADGMRALVLDLRDNPGGLLSAGVEVSDMFLDQGTIVTTKGRNTRDKAYEAAKPGTYGEFPLVVLVNQHSASASEIVAAALQDHGRAIIVGQRTYGKGSVQNILPLENGASILKLTVATYWRPSEKNIHRFQKEYDADSTEDWGVLPDEGMEVELIGEPYLKWLEYRQQRDMVSRLSPSRLSGGEAHPKNGEPEAEPEAVADLQLDKALDVLRKSLDQQDFEAVQDKAAE